MLSNCLWGISHCEAGEKLWKKPSGVMISLLLPLGFGSMKEAKVMNRQSKQRIRVKNAEAPSFEPRTSEISEKGGLALDPTKQNNSYEFGELNYGCNKNAGTTMKWETKAFPIVGEPLQKYQSLDFSSVLLGAGPDSKPVNAAGRYFNSKGPITRTKSTPFELTQQIDTNELGIKDNFSRLASQPNSSGPEQTQKAVHVSSAELNYSLSRDSKHQVCNASGAKQHDARAFSAQSHMSSVDSPYFPSSPRSAGSKMSLDLSEEQARTVLPCSLLPTSSATLFSYYDPDDSLALNPPTNFPSTLNQEIADVGKLCLKAYMAFYFF